MDLLLLVGHLVAFPAAMISIGFTTYHLFRMLWNFRDGGPPILAHFMGPLILLVPGFFNDSGNHHRKRLLVWLPIVAVSLVTLSLTIEQIRSINSGG